MELDAKGIQKVACANGKCIKKTSNMSPTSIPKSMKNRYKIHARNKDTQKMNIHQQSDKKRKWGMRKTQTKYVRTKYKNEN